MEKAKSSIVIVLSVLTYGMIKASFRKNAWAAVGISNLSGWPIKKIIYNYHSVPNWLHSNQHESLLKPILIPFVLTIFADMTPGIQNDVTLKTSQKLSWSKPLTTHPNLYPPFRIPIRITVFPTFSRL
jgi:hypothetical protein